MACTEVRHVAKPEEVYEVWISEAAPGDCCKFRAWIKKYMLAHDAPESVEVHTEW